MKNFTNNANKMINNHIQTNTESISQLSGSQNNYDRALKRIESI